MGWVSMMSMEVFKTYIYFKNTKEVMNMKNEQYTLGDWFNWDGIKFTPKNEGDKNEFTKC